MPISTEYRPGTFLAPICAITLDGWGAGSQSAFFDSTLSGVVDNQGTEWSITKFEGWLDAPDPRTSLTERPGEHGAFDGPAFLQPRVLTLEGVAVCVSHEAMARARDIITSVCGDPSLGLFTLRVSEPGRPIRRCSVRRSGDTKTAAINPTTMRWSMILVAPDPRRYNDIENSKTTSVPSAGAGGLVFPLVFPLTFGAGNTGGELTLTNAGTMAVWPKFELTAVAAIRITNVDTGAVLAFDPPFFVNNGELLVIDTDAKTVLLNGVNRRNKLVTAGWFPLPPGDTHVRFSGGSFFGFETLTAKWRDAWT